MRPPFAGSIFFDVPSAWQSPPICLLTGSTDGLHPFRRMGIRYFLSQQEVEKSRFRTIINGCIFGLGLMLMFVASLPGTGPPEDAIILFSIMLGSPFILASALLARTWCQPIHAWKIREARIRIAGVPVSVRNAILQMGQASLISAANADTLPAIQAWKHHSQPRG
ncbi:MAG: hypothetical protein EOO09_22750 [Chitinophagaceae bacterium]|nr:MAG: hypothetical protein EOO09_22750 [Chitinophagaceae bacterium]